MNNTDADLARRLSIAAGQLLMELRRTGPAEARALGDVADKASNALLMTALRRERPDDAILSEEEADDRSRLTARRVWLVDPLDGTREYGERRDDWAVHVALSIDGRIADGAVAQPALGQCFCTAHPPALQPVHRPLRIAVSRSRPAATCASAQLTMRTTQRSPKARTSATSPLPPATSATRPSRATAASPARKPGKASLAMRRASAASRTSTESWDRPWAGMRSAGRRGSLRGRGEVV
jgi:3'-phosphoadenosine 5'-phosphosulfate (PAPS) 3'-phosphatase